MVGPFFIIAEGDGYVYKLRKCNGGKVLKSYVHSNRLRPFHDSCDLFYTRNTPSTTSATSATPSQPTDDNTSNTNTTDLGDRWYEIDKITSCRMIGGKAHFLVHWKNGDRSYEPEENVSDYAKAQYYARY